MRKVRPMIFQRAMVQALTDGRKTQTRRLNGLEAVNKNPDVWRLSSVGRLNSPRHPHNGKLGAVFYGRSLVNEEPIRHFFPCPYGGPGDLVYVRESAELTTDDCAIGALAIRYLADGAVVDVGQWPETCADVQKWVNGKWRRPSIHLPRWASRLTLRLVDVRVQRLHDITGKDAMAEGIERASDAPFWAWKDYSGHEQLLSPTFSFQTLWEAINGSESWETDPWVWALSFEVIRQNVDKLENDLKEAA